MAGFGKTLANAVIGGIGGYGDYLTARGKIDEDAKQDAVNSQRAMALEEFRAKIQGERDARLDENERGQIVLTGMVNRSNNQAEIATKAQADAAGDARDLEMWKKKNDITFATWKKEQTVNLSNDKAKALYDAETKARFEAQKSGLEKVTDDVADDTGTRVVTFKDSSGNLRTYDTGVVVQQKTQTDPFGIKTEATKPAKKPTVGWRDSPAPSQAGAGAGGRSNVDIAVDQLLTTYGAATPERYPGLFRNGKKIPIEQAKEMVRRRYGG